MATYRAGLGAGLVALAEGMALAAAAAAPAAPDANCAAVTKKSARLACYDRAAEGGQSGSAPASPRAGQPIANGLGAEQVRDRRPLSERPAEVTSTVARVVSATDSGIGHWRFALSNGAVWEMPQAEPMFQPPRSGETVRIRRGAIGSYILDAGMQAGVKVTRIR